ncbi:TatD family hydrolase [Candidatus Dependentiae bacterium]|nr:TatD family hydrolase [Candidatus Dependentiae bacterium]
MFVDTHCHLTMMAARGESVDDVVRDAARVGVAKILTIGTTLQDSLASVEIAQRYDGVWATVGMHPCDCTQGWRKDFREIEALCCNKKENKIVGLGETGLDFYHQPFFKQRQIDAFVAHIECALEHDLPVIVHIRESLDEVLAVLEKYKNELTGVAHCFSQSHDIAQTLVSWGFYLGIGGPVSYPKNGSLRELVRDILLENFLLETDAPFLPPQQFRGKTNYPKYIPMIAQVIADVKGVSLENVGVVTSRSVEKLFSMPSHSKSTLSSL